MATKTVSRTFTVVKNGTKVYKEPKKSTVVNDVDKASNIYSASKQNGSYFYFSHFGGWINSSNLKSTSKPPTTTKNKADAYNDRLADVRSSQGQVEGKVFRAAVAAISKANKNSKFDESTRLFGAPHRFNRFADMPISATSQLGRKYSETITSSAPIVCISPGRPNYLDGMRSNAERKGFTMGLFKSSTDNTGEASKLINKILSNNDLRYFTFASDYAGYMNYVNLMCRLSAVYLGIDQKRAVEKTGKAHVKYRYYNWQYYRYHRAEKSPLIEKPKTIGGTSIFDAFKKKVVDTSKELLEKLKGIIMSNDQYVQFYVDPATSFQETATNTSGESFIANKLNVADDMIKEINFLTNAIGAGALSRMGNEAANVLSNSTNAIAWDSPIKRIMAGSSIMLTGASIYFPEVYKSSEYSRSYNVTINLTSPYGDDESIYLNTLVPLFHLVGFAFPKQQSSNAYSSPFLVRATCKGLFNIEMGLVESLAIEKVQASANRNGLPTEIKVTMTIKDIYPTMMMTSTYTPLLYWENDSYRQWIAVLSGLDITRPNPYEKISSMLAVFQNMLFDVPDHVSFKVQDIVTNFIYKITGGNI